MLPGVFQPRWPRLAACMRRFFAPTVAVLTLLLTGCERTQSRKVSDVTVDQHFPFRNMGGTPSGVTLHVRGHIDGEAKVYAANWTAEVISGDVDWTVGHDYFDPEIVVEYKPTRVTAGHLDFELIFQ